MLRLEKDHQPSVCEYSNEWVFFSVSCIWLDLNFKQKTRKILMFKSFPSLVLPSTTFLSHSALGAAGPGELKFSPEEGDCLTEKRRPPVHEGFRAPQAFLPSTRCHVQLQLSNPALGFPPSPYASLDLHSSCCPLSIYLLGFWPQLSNSWLHWKPVPLNYCNISLVYELVLRTLHLL